MTRSGNKEPVSRKCLRITHRPTGTALADGPAGVWDIFEFDGGYYISWRYVRATGAFRPNFLPGLCFYKGLYVGMDLRLTGGRGARDLGWLYWLPNPLLPFIWYRLVLPVGHPDLSVEEREAPPAARGSKARNSKECVRNLSEKEAV